MTAATREEAARPRWGSRAAAVLLALGALLVTACQRPGVCPEGMKPASNGASERALWCRGEGGRSAWIELYEAGSRQRRQLCPFVNQRLDGAYQAWHPSEKPWISGKYTAGALDGLWVQVDAQGRKVAEGQYREGRLLSGVPVAMAATCARLKP